MTRTLAARNEGGKTWLIIVSSGHGPSPEAVQILADHIAAL